MEFKEERGKVFLRVSMAFVFIYFGFVQVGAPDDWIGTVPEFLDGTIVSANNIVIFNGVLEITFGIFMFIGLYTKFSALILSIHLALITLGVGFNPVGIRDFGLTIATLVVFFNGSDGYCVDKRYISEKEKQEPKRLINESSQ